VRTLLNQNQPGAHGGFAADFATADGQRVLVTALTWRQVADLAHATRLAGMRSLVIDVMSPEQLRRLERAAHRIMSRNGLWHDHEGNP